MSLEESKNPNGGNRQGSEVVNANQPKGNATMNSVAHNALVTIDSINIRTDEQGRYCLNDLHKAAVANGANERTKEPSKFLTSTSIIELVQELTSPKRGTSKSRQRVLIDYYLSLDMAKELSMVEKTDKGREVRRYFIKCEKVLMQVNNNLMMQFNRALLEFEKFSDLASQAGRTLNYVGKQLKPQSKSKLDALGQKIQPMLNLFDPENEKADCTRQSQQSASSTQTAKKGTDV